MTKLKTKALIILGTMSPLLTLASDYDYNYSGELDETAAAGFAVIGIALIVVSILAGLIGLAFFIFWIVMLIDCIKREFEQRNTWLIILIVSIFLGLSWLATILYYFMIKRKNIGTISSGETLQEAPVQPVAPTEKPKQ